MQVNQIMTGHPRTVHPDNRLVEAAGLMRELDVGALPVLDGEELAGILTDRDLVVRGMADGMDPNAATVRDVMSGGVEFVFADQAVEEAVRVMESRKIRRLPVVDRSKRLVGMVSLGDIATSSNPAFSGMALRDVSEPTNPTPRQKRLAQASEPPRISLVQGGGRTPVRSGATRRKRSASRTTSSRTRSSGTSSRRTRTRPAKKTPARAKTRKASKSRR